MTFTKRIATAAAGLSLVAAPVAAAATPTAPAAKLSVARAAAPTARGNKLGAGVGGTTLINIGILAALVAVVLVATSSGDDSDSN